MLDLQEIGGESLTGVRFTLDRRVSALSYLAMALWSLGYPRQCVAASMQALDEARGIGHAFTLTFALGARTILSAGLGADWHRAAIDADQALTHSIAHGFPLYECWARFYQGAALAGYGSPLRGIELMRSALGSAKKINAGATRTVHLGHLAAAYANLGEPEVGLGLVGEAILAVEKTKERLFEAELYRIRGEMFLASGKKRKAEAALHRALTVARDQQARMWELRAATSLARLLYEEGRAAEAFEVLAPVYGWFTEGFDTPDLKRAKALFEALDA